jgi:hypothetical protein
MENNVEILIPFFDYCGSKWASKNGELAFKKFNNSKKLDVLDVELIKHLFTQFKRELYNPDYFYDLILNIFLALDYEYEDFSTVFINSIKRLISIKAFELELPTIKIDSNTFFVINNFDDWFDFLDKLHRTIFEMDGIYFVMNNKKKHLVFCPASLDSNNNLRGLTEVMTTEINDYWIQQFKRV